MIETFAHRFVKGSNGVDTILLLHGTGGNEDDLLSLGRDLAPKANLLSPRGKVLEQGMPRFFRRIRPGVFDLEDLRLRTGELAQFVRDAAAEYRFDPTRVIAVGYSNGANIAASALYREPDLLAGALLLRPMNPWPGEAMPSLNGIPVLIAAGKHDMMSSLEDIEGLSSALKKAGADVSVHWHPGGHELGQDDLTAALNWMSRCGKPVVPLRS
jgi:predicted esterase